MEKKWFVCDDCGRNLSSYKCLWRHKKTCASNHVDGLTDRQEDILPQYEKYSSGAKRAASSEPSYEKKSKIAALADAIINDTRVRKENGSLNQTSSCW